MTAIKYTHYYFIMQACKINYLIKHKLPSRSLNLKNKTMAQEVERMINQNVNDREGNNHHAGDKN